jgi:hypothetical protein
MGKVEFSVISHYGLLQMRSESYTELSPHYAGSEESRNCYYSNIAIYSILPTINIFHKYKLASLQYIPFASHQYSNIFHIAHHEFCISCSLSRDTVGKRQILGVKRSFIKYETWE